MNIAQDLERLFLPSRWSKRYPPEIIVDKHVEFCNQESKKAQSNIPNTLNVSYGPLTKEKIDIFGTDLDNDAPILAFVHGGYWQEQSLTRDTYHFIASHLYKNGIKSCFIGYELCPEVSLEKIIDEIVTATKKCILHVKEKQSRGLYLAGYSAGSHLVATLFTNIVNNFSSEEQGLIKGVVLIAGIYDLTDLPKTTINEPLRLNEKDATKLSPLKQHICKNVATRFYVVSAENDSPEFKKQSTDFEEKLKRAGINSKEVVVKNVDHFSVVELLSNEDFEVTKLIVDLIKQ